jgi:demethylmenaquinone methyltransferase/2-methoxy-6-polyprenyl-1,4-benzoquinol methylase
VAIASPRRERAKALFAPLGPTYDRYARLLSFGQDPRWRRFLVSQVDVGPEDTVLDVATGTGAVALELQRQKRCTVVGLDQSAQMLEIARQRLPAADLVEADADNLPFPDASFDALTFTYLLRYVDDPAATLRELARVVRPGATIAGLEFGVPPNPLARAAWRAYVHAGLPLAGRLISPGWAGVGDFLGPSIEELWRRLPLPRLLDLWRDAEIVEVRARRLSLGGGIVIWGRRSRRLDGGSRGAEAPAVPAPEVQ